MAISTIDATGLSQSQIVSAINMPTGTVIQVVQGTTSSPIGSTTAVNVATNLTASITPQFSTSRILVSGMIWVSASLSTTQPVITLYRNGSSATSTGYGFGNIYSTAGGYSEAVIPFSYLDSPASTSSLTYTLYGRNASTVGAAAFGDSNRLAVIILQEIR